jgi:endoglucanase
MLARLTLLSFVPSAIAALSCVLSLGACAKPAVQGSTHAKLEPPKVPARPDVPIPDDAPLAFRTLEAEDPKADPLPKVRFVGTIAPTLVHLLVTEGELVYTPIAKYVPEPGDKIVDGKPDKYGTVHERFLERGGKRMGVIAGPPNNLHLVRGPDRIGKKLDVEAALRPASYTLTSGAGKTIKPVKVHEKRKPVGRSEGAGPLRQFELFLELPEPLQEGSRYTLELASTNVDNPRIPLDYDTRTLRSDALHVSHTGFRPDDPDKVGFLSIWLGTGGAYTGYSEGLPCQLLEQSTGKVVYETTTKLTLSHDKESFGHHAKGRNFPKTDVYLCDFSEFKTPGRYVLSVPGVGRSFAFPIDEQAWEVPLRVSFRGFYHQRSGIEWKPPFADWERPRDFHPDDGHVFYEANVSRLAYGKLGGDGNLEALLQHVTKKRVANAWGGYHDAGDYDRHAGHLEASRNMLELFELSPDYFKKLVLEIPEKDNSLPDILDEARWGIDLFKRTQRADGAIYSGVETNGHPKKGETSYLDSLTKIVYAPDIRASWWYVASAAQAAHVLAGLGEEALAKEYADSARAAMQWAEREYTQNEKKYRADYKDVFWNLKDARNLAAVQLYRATDDQKWHEVFLETVGFRGGQGVRVWASHNQDEAAIAYLLIPKDKANAKLQEDAVAGLRKHADLQIEYAERQAFQWTANDHGMPLILGTLAAPQGRTIVRAYHASKDPKYLKWALRTTQWSVGANPLNMTFATKLGYDWPRFVLKLDQMNEGKPEAPAGYVPYGTSDLVFIHQDWITRWFINEERTNPGWKDWAVSESYFDLTSVPMVNENTIEQTQTPTMYVWSYLAARQ